MTTCKAPTWLSVRGAARSRRIRPRRVLGLLALALLLGWALICLTPLYWIFATALKKPSLVLSFPPSFIPEDASFLNLRRLFIRSSILWWTFNSLVVALAVTASNVLLATLAGYTLAKKRFPGDAWLFAGVIGIMLIPPQITIVPLFILVNWFGWADSYRALIVPLMLSPSAVFLMKQHLATFPSALLDSARIDGCGELRIFLRIVLPLAKPGIAVLSIFTFMGNWNSFLWPLLVTSSERMRTLQIGLASLQIENANDYGLMMAGAAYSAIPMIAFFLAFQRYFVQGITVGALKA